MMLCFNPRRIIVDESALLYHMGTQESYPPMRFIVSDNDMKNRLEQTKLVVGTMTHFGYEKFDHIVMHGTHYTYCETGILSYPYTPTNASFLS